MSTVSEPEIYFSFFMYTVDLLQPEKPDYTKVLIEHLAELATMGYDGYDLHIQPQPASLDPADDEKNFKKEENSYCRLKEAFDAAGFKYKKFATNVGTTTSFDPTSPYEEQRKRALAYLKSRVRITSILNGGAPDSIMSGPFIYPYGAFPVTDAGPLWSDALQDWMKPRFAAAQPVIEELAEYAAQERVLLAIEPVKNWETPPPNMVSEVLKFLSKVKAPCGITIDTAQVLLESQGPTAFLENVTEAARANQLNYIHISAPDRGAVHDCWIPWDVMLGAIEPVYRGPYLIEVFNAIPPLDAGMKMTRPRFWRQPEDKAEGPERPSATYIARKALEQLRAQIKRIRAARAKRHSTHPGDADRAQDTPSA